MQNGNKMYKEPITLNGLNKLKEEDMQNSIYCMIEVQNLDYKQVVMLRGY